MEPTFKINDLRDAAAAAGFVACGVAKADVVDEHHASALHNWTDSGMYGTMEYMVNNADKRLDPRLLLEGAKSVIAVAMNYYPQRLLDDSRLQFSYYAYGQDYHEVVRGRLRQLVRMMCDGSDIQTKEDIDRHFKICCDTVPMLERYWAKQAGLGWTGKNCNLIIPNIGSYVFLGSIITSLEFDSYDSPVKEQCGQCTQCLQACPTKALRSPHSIDARRCLSYLTIEHRGPIPEEFHKALGTCIYGCDRCQKACPYNRNVRPTDVEELAASEYFLSMTKDDWAQLTEEEFRRLFRHSAVKRTKFEGLSRNIEIVLNNISR